jgi:hypothetical protein
VKVCVEVEDNNSIGLQQQDSLLESLHNTWGQYIRYDSQGQQGVQFSI